MKNFERYKTVSAVDYDRKDVMYYLCRVPSDKKILPLIAKIKNKKVLDVGIGTGYYSKYLLKQNNVCGIDQNPHLNELPVSVYKANASDFAKSVVGQEFDIVLSTWMTEYLGKNQLIRFFSESRKVLKQNGQLITTIVLPKGIGWLYIKMAKYFKGISKYYYSADQTTELLQRVGFNDIKIINLKSQVGLPWAILVIAS